MSQKIYIGIDSSTSCTGVVAINEKCELMFWRHIYTKTDWKYSNSFGDGYDVIYKAFKELIVELGDKDKYDIQKIGLEANSFGSYEGTMKLAIVLGIIHGVMRTITKAPIVYITAQNWRTIIIDADPNEDLQDPKVRAEFKYHIANWFESTFCVKLPLFKMREDAVIPCNGILDYRVNDISDAGGIAFGCFKNLVNDRKTLKIINNKQSRELSNLKKKAMIYKKESEILFKLWKKDKSKKTTETLSNKILSWLAILDMLKNKNKLLKYHHLQYNRIEELKKEIELNGKS